MYELKRRHKSIKYFKKEKMFGTFKNISNDLYTLLTKSDLSMLKDDGTIHSVERKTRMVPYLAVIKNVTSVCL